MKLCIDYLRQIEQALAAAAEPLPAAADPLPVPVAYHSFGGWKRSLFGDLSAYVIGQRAQITTVVLRERFADTDQVGIVMFERVGGAVWNPDAIRIGVV